MNESEILPYVINASAFCFSKFSKMTLFFHTFTLVPYSAIYPKQSN